MIQYNTIQYNTLQLTQVRQIILAWWSDLHQYPQILYAFHSVRRADNVDQPIHLEHYHWYQLKWYDWYWVILYSIIESIVLWHNSLTTERTSLKQCWVYVKWNRVWMSCIRTSTAFRAFIPDQLCFNDRKSWYSKRDNLWWLIVIDLAKLFYTNQLIDWLIDWLIDRLIDWLIDWWPDLDLRCSGRKMVYWRCSSRLETKDWITCRVSISYHRWGQSQSQSQGQGQGNKVWSMEFWVMMIIVLKGETKVAGLNMILEFYCQLSHNVQVQVYNVECIVGCRMYCVESVGWWRKNAIKK
jgi:hypothetical protein